MTQEDKQLLLKDLAARLLYGVKVSLENEGERLTGVLDAIFPNENRAIVAELNKPIAAINVRCGGFDLEENIVRPYLRPMSSMTEEEFEKLKEYSELKYEQLDLASYQNGTYKCLDFYLSEVPSYVVILVFDWLNAHHFDYRGLIEKGLAIEVTEENNPYERK